MLMMRVTEEINGRENKEIGDNVKKTERKKRSNERKERAKKVSE